MSSNGIRRRDFLKAASLLTATTAAFGWESATGMARSQEAPRPSVKHRFSLAYLTVFGSIIAYSAYLYLLKTVRPAAATSYAYVNPAVAVLLGVTFAGEHVGVEEGLAMVLIILAVVLIALPKSRQRVH